MKVGGFLMVADQRGKLGGTVYSRSRSGHTVRTRVKPRNPRSSAQLQIRELMTNGSRFAKALSTTNVNAWKSYALSLTKHQSVSGAAYHPSWITAINELFIPFFLATPGGTFPTSPPTTPYEGDVITLSAAGGVGDIIVTGSAQQTAGQTTFLYLEHLVSANREPSAKTGKLVSVAPIPATPFQITLSGLAPGTYVLRSKFVKLATGQESPLQTVGTFQAT